MDEPVAATGAEKSATIAKPLKGEASSGVNMMKRQKRKRRTHQYGRKRSQYKGRKERLRSQNEDLKKSVQSALQEQSKLETKAAKLLKETVRLRRKCCSLSKSMTASHACGTKASEGYGGIDKDQTKYSLQGVRVIQRKDLHVSKKCIGHGVFGNCFLGKLAHIGVCVKVLKKHHERVFPTEAHILYQCCHANLPWLYGIVVETGCPKIIVMSFHGNCEQKCSLHQLLCSHSDPCSSTLSIQDAKSVLLGLISALKYLHSKQILHNDIKSDNIVVERTSSNAKGVLVDLGKACYVSDAKRYTLSKEERRSYSENHPQIAPDLREGHCKQSYASDVYSTGRVLACVNDRVLNIPVIASFSNLCKDYLCSKRPTTDDVYTFLHNLFSG